VRPKATVDAKIMGRALGLLFVAGATIGAISMLLPHSADADEAGLWSNIALAYVGGAVLLAFGQRFPTWLFHVTLVAGTLLIARAVYLSGEEVSFYNVWFVWIGLVAFYFFDRRAAAAHVAFASIVFAGTLVDEPGSSPVGRWLTTVATLVVAGVFIDTLVRRAHRQAAAADQSARNMTMVAEVAHELARLSDSQAAGPALCQAARRLTGARSVSLWLPTPDGSTLGLNAAAGPNPTQRGLPFVGPPAGGVNAFTTGELVKAHGPQEVGQLAPEFTGENELPGTALWQPVLRDGVGVAVLAFYWATPRLAEEEGVVTLTNLLAAEASVTLERVNLLSRLETVARTDDLTGLPNRRAWQEELPREIARSRREDKRLCVAMLDLDHFKAFNDELGHQAGDRLLKQAAAAWSAQLRGSDLLARYGGEEFALALPACPADEALTVVERLRAVTPQGQTCSAGVVCFDGDETPADLVGRADAALYEAKNAGRDRTVVSLTPAQ
jgi:diguanylate cyclase (GGDEF)-like protein